MIRPFEEKNVEKVVYVLMVPNEDLAKSGYKSYRYVASRCIFLATDLEELNFFSNLVKFCILILWVLGIENPWN